ncbi:hypothetical protein [Nitriliruptor alkaliphilus]|uniref:hypothetical protein n=1 Tax=Nitriliruptor alkaliphilus TaxID=427918 RepID=UPI0006974ACB|nr:hypothetical protein [Nitriliruptor alkaliphilus]
MARRGTIARDIERELVRAARRQRPTHGQVRRAADDPQLVADRFTVRPDWDRPVDGRAPRLSSTETIAVSGVGRFEGADPLTVVVGWRSLGRLLGVGVLAAGVGLSWWRGSRWGTGPLGTIRDDRPWP